MITERILEDTNGRYQDGRCSSRMNRNEGRRSSRLLEAKDDSIIIELIAVLLLLLLLVWFCFWGCLIRDVVFLKDVVIRTCLHVHCTMIAHVSNSSFSI